MQTVETSFLTLHLSGNDVHLRTRDGIVLVSKDQPELQARARELKRGQRIRVSGELERSKVLSTPVIAAQALEVLR